MSVPEIGRTKDVGREIGGPAIDPFPLDEDGDEDIAAQVTASRWVRVRDRLEASA